MIIWQHIVKFVFIQTVWFYSVKFPEEGGNVNAQSFQINIFKSVWSRCIFLLPTGKEIYYVNHYGKFCQLSADLSGFYSAGTDIAAQNGEENLCETRFVKSPFTRKVVAYLETKFENNLHFPSSRKRLLWHSKRSSSCRLEFRSTKFRKSQNRSKFISLLIATDR